MGYLYLLVLLFQLFGLSLASREFRVDYENQQFLKDGKPFSYISGSVHYFRIHPDQWENRLRMVRAAGLNAIQTYIPWNFHETYKGIYNFEGDRNFTRFFEIAQSLDLLVLARFGPYVCGEWENGGLPYWLLKNDNISLRVSDPIFIRESLQFMEVILKMAKPYLYNNGGPVIMSQMENEYGSFACDKVYTAALRDKAVEILGKDAVLYTTDGPSLVKCGQIENVFVTVDFGGCKEEDCDKYFDIQRKANNGGPFVNSEYYPGWFALWGDKTDKLKTATAKEIQKMTKYFISRNASFNIYMFHGGTNFAFWNGAESNGPLITSYDYWAPMTENGIPNEKYYAIREVIEGLPNWPNKPLPVPKPIPTLAAKGLSLSKFGNIFDYFPKIIDKSRCSTNLSTFEQLDQPSGFVKYSLTIPTDAETLNGTFIKDYGFSYVNKEFRGRTSTTPKKVQTVKIDAKSGDKLDIIVESQGRRTYETIKDYKGIVGDLLLDGNVVDKSQIQSCPIDIDLLAQYIEPQETTSRTFTPGDIYVGEFSVSKAGDTNIDMTGWGKGIVFFNGVNIGRYWSTMGPQYSLYIPSPLVQKLNEVVIVEFEKLSSQCLPSTKYCQFDLLHSPIPY